MCTAALLSSDINPILFLNGMSGIGMLLISVMLLPSPMMLPLIAISLFIIDPLKMQIILII